MKHKKKVNEVINFIEEEIKEYLYESDDESVCSNASTEYAENISKLEQLKSISPELRTELEKRAK